MEASLKTTQELHSKYIDIFSGICSFQGTFFLAGQRRQENVPGMWHMHYRNDLKRIRRTKRAMNNSATGVQ